MVIKIDFKTTAKMLVIAGAVGGMVSKELSENEEFKIKQTDVPVENYYPFMSMTPDQTSTSAAMASSNFIDGFYRL